MSFSTLLPVHIAAGVVGILSGAAAMCFLKGSPRHALAGKIFVVSMVTMAATAAYLAVLRHQSGNILGGAFTLYLVTTAWLTARRKDGETSTFDWLAMLLPLVAGILLWISGIQMVRHQIWSHDGAPVGMNFFMGSVLLLAAAGDIRMLLHGGLFGAQRIVRHLWRMCFAFFIATGSFFLGQGSKVFPSLVGQSNLLFIPALLPLALLIFWLFRVRLMKAYHRKPIVAGG
jgi:uncharacterized membrane protein